MKLFQDMLCGRPGRTAAILLGAAIGMIAVTSRGQDFPLMEELMVPSVTPVVFGAAAWGDFDRDGDFDLFYLGNYGRIASPVNLGQLFINNGDVTVSTPGGPVPASDYSRGIDSRNPFAKLWRGSVSLTDLNNDGRLDAASTGADEQGSRHIAIYEGIDGADRFRQLEHSGGTGAGLIDGALSWADRPWVACSKICDSAFVC